ncbi:MAG: hypothetical protein KatS3mg025_1087 [Bacteroidia bacterium]|nr:MAG: hypothetical protein KatS3mg025_1087 [Bacteroidia bacterium]
MTPEIAFIGAGGAHDIALGNSAALLRWEGQTFLLDCGFTVYPRLVEKGLVEKIDAICITHLHDDHIGSLSALLYHRHFLSKLPPLPVLVGVPELHAKLYTYLHFLMGPVEQFAQLVGPEGFPAFIAAIPTSGLHMPHMPSAAYLFKGANGYLLYSGDIGVPVPVLQRPGWVEAHQPIWVFHDVAFRRVPTHCYYEDLYPWVGKVELWGYHCNPAEAPENLRFPLAHERFKIS